MKRFLGFGIGALAMGISSAAFAAHVHFFVDAAGGQVIWTPSSGSFSGGHYSDPFAATGVSDAYLPGIAVSLPTITTLENADGEQSFDIQNHDIGVKVVGMSVVSGAPAATFSWLITAQDKEFVGQDTGNPADQLVTATVNNGSFSTSGVMEMGPLAGGVPTGNHWHGQHMTLSAAGVYDVTFQLVDLNGVEGVGGTYGVLGNSPLYTVRFASAVPEPATAGVLALGALSLLRRRRKA